MPTPIIAILLVFGLVFFVLDAFKVPDPNRHNFTAAGLACWILTEILTRFLK